MRSFFLSALTVMLLLLVMDVKAQDGNSMDDDSIRISIKPYGSFRGHLAMYNNEMEFQENASRIGFEFSVQKKKTRFFIVSELQMNMFKSNSVFNADANLDGGFLVLESKNQTDVFGTRLGYLGVDIGKFGTISAGKQWSVYYDVTSFTDHFNVFGVQASATLVAGTDGGETGTGRADQSLIYRNTFGPVSVGAQMQAKNVSNNSFVDGFGFSASVKILKELKVGAAFNRGYINKDIIDAHSILGLSGQPGYFAAGISYTGEKLQLGAVYAHQTNGDLTQGYFTDSAGGIHTPTVVYDANGLELYGKYIFGKIAVLAGYNYYQPATENIRTPTGEQPIADGYKKNFIILGLEYKPTKLAYLYAEQRISNGKTALGTKEFDVFTVGIRIDINRTFSKAFR